MSNIVPLEVEEAGVDLSWNGDMPLPDTSKLENQLDQNIQIMFKQLGIKE